MSEADPGDRWAGSSEHEPPLERVVRVRVRGAARRRPRAAELAVALLAMTGAAFLVIAYTPLANFLAMPLCTVSSRPSKADIAIILSAGRYRDGSLNEDALQRTVAGVRLFHQGLVPRLLFSGGPCCGESASALMARLAADLGVPPEAILLEEQSARTYDSAMHSAALLRRHGFESVILVTSTLHITRARLAFEAAGVSVQPVRASEMNLLLVSSASERISLMQAAVHEYLGLAFYRIRGWI